MPQLISGGYLYIAQPPLYRYERQERDMGLRRRPVEGGAEADRQGEGRIQRYKGLGEMTLSSYGTPDEPDTRTLLKVTVEDAMVADRRSTC